MDLSTIVVGVDFSHESDRAVEHAMGLARRSGAALVLAHVVSVPPSVFLAPADEWESLVRQRESADRTRLRELGERLQGQGVEVSQVVVDGPPDTALAETATSLNADLVVIGTHGRTGVKRLLLGSVAEKTTRFATSSVLVSRGDASPAGYRRVVVGTDGSPTAWRATALALAVAAPGARVEVVYAWHAPYIEYDLSGQVLMAMREAAVDETRAQRDRLLALPRADGVTVTLDLVDGSAFEVLARRSEDADLVVVGSHGRRGLRRFVLGSVAEATVRHAACSVLVAR